MPREPRTDAEFRAFCQDGRGFVFSTLNGRLHQATCPVLPWSYSHGKLLWAWEAPAHIAAYLNRHRQGWAPCPYCCDAALGQDAQAEQETPRPASAPTELQRALAHFHLAAGAPLDIAESAYRTLMRKVHPDVGGTTEQARAATAAITIIRNHYQQPV